jgi:long-chain acyl-CoA synthetase
VRACVVLRDEYVGQITANSLRTHCRKHLAAYKVPRLVEFRAQLPMSAAGKLLRRALREEALQEH